MKPGENLSGRNGISKTMVWKKYCAVFGTSQMRKRSLFGVPVPSKGGGFVHP
jgi:hypothetical protein